MYEFIPIQHSGFEPEVIKELQASIFSGGEAYPVRMIKDIIDQKSSYLCLYDGVLAGFLLGGYYNGVQMVISLGVDSKYRRRKIAESLLCLFVLNYGKDNDLYLNVETTNNGAMRLYKKLGFEVIKFEKGYYGKDRDSYYMRRNKNTLIDGMVKMNFT